MHLLCCALLFGQCPGLFLVDILIGTVRQRDDLTNRLVEFALFIPFSYGLTAGDKGFDHGFFRAARRQRVVEAVAQKAGATAGDVDHFADDIGVDPLHKVFQVQVDVID